MRQLMSFKKFLDAGAPNIFFESFEEEVTEELSGNIKTKKLIELSKKLKEWDYTYIYSDERNAYKKGVAQEKEIISLYKEIGAEGLKMYRDFLKSKGMKENNLTTPRLNPWEKFLYKKLKEWGLQSPEDLDALEPEPRKRFNDELDKAWASSKDNKKDVVVNESVKKSNPPRTLSEAIRQVTDGSGFSEMQNVEGRGTLDYAVRQVGDKSLTASSFGDSGNLYPEHLVSKFIPPSKDRMRKLR